MISKIGHLNIVETNDTKRSNLLDQIDIKNIIDLVTENKELFVVLVEVLNRYVLPFENEEDEIIRKEDINAMIDAAHDRLINVECSIINDFKFLIDKLYLVDYSGILSDARGIIFEELVHNIGIESEFAEKYREAQIYLDGETDQLGKSGHDFDSIFHNNKNVHLIECKISASNFLRAYNGKYKEKSTSKLNYMKRTGEELNNQNMNNSLFIFTGSYSVKKIKRDFKKKYNSIELLARRDVLNKCMG